MKKICLVLLMWLSFSNCKNSDSDLDTTKIIDADTFIKAFPVMTPPVTIADTALKNFGDTLIISKEVFTQFIADSGLQLFTGNQNNYIIHPAALLHKNDKDFLLAKFSSAKQI